METKVIEMVQEKKLSAVERGLVTRFEEVTGEEIERDLALINKYALKPMSAAEVFMRSMFLCSTELCEWDCCKISLPALQQMAQQCPGNSVLVGHDRRIAPIARFYKTDVVTRQEYPTDEAGHQLYWLRAWFYWPRQAQDAQDLQVKIDSGVYREVSVSFLPGTTQCSICGLDIWKPGSGCTHWPGMTYDGKLCTWTVLENEEFMEGSIVYKGAEKNTGLMLRGKHHPRMDANERAAKQHSVGVLRMLEEEALI